MSCCGRPLEKHFENGVQRKRPRITAGPFVGALPLVDDFDDFFRLFDEVVGGGSLNLLAAVAADLFGERLEFLDGGFGVPAGEGGGVDAFVAEYVKLRTTFHERDLKRQAAEQTLA